jgi:uncharacterized protein (DUF1810 family)
MADSKVEEEVYTEVLDRILACQNDIFPSSRANNTGYEVALQEIKNGEKRSHWIWYIFPCPKGVRTTGRPDLEIPNMSTAQEYLKNEVLRARLLEITTEAYKHIDPESASAKPIEQLTAVFGSTDAGKFNETVTFFAVAAGLNGDAEAVKVFSEALLRTNAGKLELKTLGKLKKKYPQKCSSLAEVNDLEKLN